MAISPRHNFKDSIRRMFLLYAFVPILLLFILFLAFTVVNARVTLSQQTREAARSIRAALDDAYRAYEWEMARMSALPEVIEFTRSRRDGPRVFEQFYNFNNRQTIKSVMHLLNAQGDILASSANLSPESADNALKAIAQRMFRNRQSALTETNHIRFSHDRYTVYTLAHDIRENGQVIGYLLYQLYEADMQKQIFVRNNEIAIVADRHNTIIATTNNIVRGPLNKLTLERENGEIVINNGRYRSSETVVPSADWHIYTLNAVQLMNSTYLSLIIFFTVASLLLLLLIQFLARAIAARHTQAIDKLIYAVGELQAGNMRAYVHLNTGDEFELLADQYNAMLTRLNDLLTRNEELSKLRSMTEVKHLQSQFHPHFIFNVLETLRYAIVIDRDLAQQMVLLMSRLLRYSISTESDTVILKDDLNYVEDYLKLQHMRFRDRLGYTINVGKEAMNARVPRLMLQAVIENSIKYGYQQKETLYIAVNGDMVGTDVLIEVTDNGGGMSEARLRAVRRTLSEASNQTPHIGLYNLHRRLTLIYGDRYGLSIDSRAGESTTVRITLPRGKESSHV
ncbi:histidine kinase [Brenneria populi]|uniref:Histidine kinase n=1 Tax=Brenneria populi TaxID=1505588 RepID=A0ABU6JK29_9GAMM|nr:histidine kinase [Brenneria populi Li et al. 2015]